MRRLLAALVALCALAAPPKQKEKKERPPAHNKIWDKSMRCVPAPAAARNASRYAYMVVVGPISRSAPRYGTWLYPILALRHALARKGSRADLVVLCALEEGYEQDRMLPEEEALFAGQGIRWRYVPKPRIRGFHMGHYKLWAWQHTEYDRVQSGAASRFLETRCLAGGEARPAGGEARPSRYGTALDARRGSPAGCWTRTCCRWSGVCAR